MFDFFKVLADETRLRCLALIVKHHEICVCELMFALDLPQTKISRHVNLIKMNGLLSQRRINQWILYSLNSELTAYKHKLLEDTVEELLTTELYQADNQRLLKMENRPNFACRKDKQTMSYCKKT